MFIDGISSRTSIFNHRLDGLQLGFEETRFHGIFESMIPMPQVSVIPANIKPQPTKVERKHHLGSIKNPSKLPSATRNPAAIRTCLSKDMIFLPWVMGKPACAQASVPPWMLKTLVRPEASRSSQAFLPRDPLLQTTYNGSVPPNFSAIIFSERESRGTSFAKETCIS